MTPKTHYPDPDAPLSLSEWLAVIGALSFYVWRVGKYVVPILIVGWIMFYIVGPVLTDMVGG